MLVLGLMKFTVKAIRLVGTMCLALVTLIGCLLAYLILMTLRFARMLPLLTKCPADIEKMWLLFLLRVDEMWKTTGQAG